MLKNVMSVLALCAAVVVPVAASADTTPPEQTVHVLKVVTVYGHRQHPSVVIEIARLSAAHEAGAAHEAFRQSVLEKSVPATLRRAADAPAR